MKNLVLFFGVLFCTQFISCNKKISQPTNQEVVVEKGSDDEAVSDGYTTTSTRNKTGASNSVEHEKQILNLDDHIRGLSGVIVSGSGAGASITVRGVNSFQSGSNEPLFVLNGTPMASYASTYSAVDPINIKRVTVLTDAASTGIYGVRGANGVIIITLKNTK